MSKTKKKAPVKSVQLGSRSIGNELPLSIIAGPCVMESEAHLWEVAGAISRIAKETRINFIFKCSYDKANRSSHDSYRGPGMKEALLMLSQIKAQFKLPILTDVHLPSDADLAAEVADVLQIPAYLSRQTDLLIACGRTKKIVNVKKGQFLSPWDVPNIIDKIASTGNDNVLITERGTFFGYQNLVVDMRGMEIIKQYGVPVIFDATHSVQLPGGNGKSSGGQREYVFPLARAAAALGVAGIFMEVHPDPDRAFSDGPNSLRLDSVKTIVQFLKKIDRLTKLEVPKV